MNTYKFVRIVDLEEPSSDVLTERQDAGESTNKALSYRSSDTQGLNEQPRDVTLPKEDTARFYWRVNLQDNSYKYDRLVEPCWGESEGQAATRDLRRWSDDQPRESMPGRGLTDGPVSHNNLWDRKEVRPWCDIPVGAGDSGGKPRCDTSSRVYDGGSDRIPQTPPPWTTNRTYEQNDERPLRYYKIHVEKVKLCTAATQSSDSVDNLPTTH